MKKNKNLPRINITLMKNAVFLSSNSIPNIICLLAKVGSDWIFDSNQQDIFSQKISAHKKRKDDQSSLCRLEYTGILFKIKPLTNHEVAKGTFSSTLNDIWVLPPLSKLEPHSSKWNFFLAPYWSLGKSVIENTQWQHRSRRDLLNSKCKQTSIGQCFFRRLRLQTPLACTDIMSLNTNSQISAYLGLEEGIYNS